MEIYSKIDDYVNHRLSLWELESWLVPRLPLFVTTPETPLGQLAAAVELCLAELQAGLRSERSIRTLLRRNLVANPIVWVPIGELQREETTTSVNSTQPNVIPPWLSPLPTWSTSPQVAYA